MSASAFEDVSAYLAPDLELPLRGKVYRVPPPPAKVGLKIQSLWTLGLAAFTGRDKVPDTPGVNALLNDEDEFDLYTGALGPTYQEMVDDGLPLPMIKHAAITVVFDVAHGRDAALKYWHSPAGKATTARATKSTSKATGGASTTKKRASTSGTRSRKKS